ncbi:MAG: hypothetical protein JW738_02105 [Actinobacteria bacterium]|nr:hypothetical protein [Actinomycetota bacterium]
MGNQNNLYAKVRDWSIRTTAQTVFTTKLKCPRCGLPLVISMVIRWKNNGTISPIFTDRYVRVVMLHTGVYDKLFSQIEDWLGISIEHILFEAQRNFSKGLFESFQRLIPGMSLLKKVPLWKRLIVESFNRVAILTGMSYSKTLEYDPGKYGLARLKNPYNIDLMAANIVGAFEYLEMHPFKHQVTNEGGGNYLVEVDVVKEKPKISERLEYERPFRISGKKHFENCSLCRAPLSAASRLKWIEDEGKIIDTNSGSRVIMMDGFLLKTVFRELAKELGDEVNKLLVPAQRDWTVEHVELLGNAPGESALTGKEFEKAFSDYLEDLPIFGYGNPVSFVTSGKKVKVTIENPFDEYVLAGTLQGLYEIFSKQECKVSWDIRKKAEVIYSLEPA